MIRELRMEMSKLTWLFRLKQKAGYKLRKTLLIHQELLNMKMISQKLIQLKLQPRELTLLLIQHHSNKRKLIS